MLGLDYVIQREKSKKTLVFLFRQQFLVTSGYGFFSIDQLFLVPMHFKINKKVFNISVLSSDNHYNHYRNIQA